MNWLIRVMAAGFLCAGLANATLVLDVSGIPSYSQAQSSPCVIGNPSCSNPAGFPFTIIGAGGGTSSYTRTSPTYTVGQLVSLVGPSFEIGIDVNQAGSNDQTLGFFETWIGGVLSSDFSFADNGAGSGLLALANNGNGWSDALLTAVNLSAWTSLPGTEVYFRANVFNNTDGDEQFFLIAGAGGGIAEIPEPGTVVLVGAGLGLVALNRIRRRRIKAS